MAQSPSETPNPQNPQELGDLMLGVLDVIMTFGVVLANAGLLERDDIAALMSKSIDLLARHGADAPLRRWPLEAMRDAFGRPVMEGGRGAAGLVPIAGGKKDPPPDAG